MNTTPEAGHNAAPDYAATVTAQLMKDYAELFSVGLALIVEARGLRDAGPITVSARAGIFATMIKRLRDTTSRAEAYRIKEKEPYLRGEQAVDSLFFEFIEQVARRNKGGKNGIADDLQEEVDAYTQRVLAAERAERKRLADEAEAVAAGLRREEDARRKAADDAAAAAARARKPENIAHHIQVAEVNEAAANDALLQQRAADQISDRLAAAQYVKPAEMVRTRFEGGAMITAKQEPYVTILDASKIPLDLLRPYLKPSHIEQAVNAWARATEYKGTLPGVQAGHRDKGVVR